MSILHRQRVISAWALLAPMLIVLAAVAAYPLFLTIWFGFTDASLDQVDKAQWIGFQNYLDYLDYGNGEGEFFGLLADPGWWHAVGNTLYFAVISVLLETGFGLIIALVLNTNFPGRGLVRAAVLVPWAIPTIVSAKMWAWMMHDQFGILNDMLMHLHLITAPIAWTASASTAMTAVIIVDVWKTTPFMTLLILAGLQLVPTDIYEATRLDGIPPVRVFRKVTWPLISSAVFVAMVFRGLDALRAFDLMYVLTPNSEATATMSVYARQNLFDFDKFAYGSAASTLLFLIVAMITITFISATRLNAQAED